MQAKGRKKEKRRLGRPKSSNLTPPELARERKRRQRAKLSKKLLSKVEVYLPDDLKARIRSIAGEKTLAAIGHEAFRLWFDKNSSK
jgi:hypothetical protein